MSHKEILTSGGCWSMYKYNTYKQNICFHIQNCIYSIITWFTYVAFMHARSGGSYQNLESSMNLKWRVDSEKRQSWVIFKGDKKSLRLRDRSTVSNCYHSEKEEVSCRLTPGIQLQTIVLTPTPGNTSKHQPVNSRVGKMCVCVCLQFTNGSGNKGVSVGD